MTHKITITATTIVVFCLMLACSKGSSNLDNVPSPSGGTTAINGTTQHNNARNSGPSYSQSLSVDSANSMIQSYLNSVNYSTEDTALRSLTYDADTLRAYLKNPDIVTVKFMLAHKPAYTHNGGLNKYAGLSPAAITMIIVGLNDNNNYILNNRNGVYDMFSPCPLDCPGVSSAIIQ